MAPYTTRSGVIPRWTNFSIDLYHQQHSLRLLKQLARTQHLMVCCVLHDLNLASLYADRILLLHQGKLVCEGTPLNVLTTENIQKWYGADVSVDTIQSIRIHKFSSSISYLSFTQLPSSICFLDCDWVNLFLYAYLLQIKHTK